MPIDQQLWVYPQHARRVGGHYEMPGSRGNERVLVILDRDITPLIPDNDPRSALQDLRFEIQEAAQRLFDQDHVGKVTDDRAPQFWRWEIVITKADLDQAASRISNG